MSYGGGYGSRGGGGGGGYSNGHDRNGGYGGYVFAMFCIAPLTFYHISRCVKPIEEASFSNSQTYHCACSKC